MSMRCPSFVAKGNNLRTSMELGLLENSSLPLFLSRALSGDGLLGAANVPSSSSVLSSDASKGLGSRGDRKKSDSPSAVRCSKRKVDRALCRREDENINRDSPNKLVRK